MKVQVNELLPKMGVGVGVGGGGGGGGEAGVIREKHSPPHLLWSKTSVRGFHSGVNLAYEIFTLQDKASHG